MYIYFSEKTSLDISCGLSAKQMIHMKCQDLFSLKNKKKNKKLSSAATYKFIALDKWCSQIKGGCFLVDFFHVPKKT